MPTESKCQHVGQNVTNKELNGYMDNPCTRSFINCFLRACLRFVKNMSRNTICHRKNHFRCFRFAQQSRKNMIKFRFYKHNGMMFQSISAVRCKKIDLKGKILQGLFSEKFYAILAKRGVHRNTIFIPIRLPNLSLVSTSGE